MSNDCELACHFLAPNSRFSMLETQSALSTLQIRCNKLHSIDLYVSRKLIVSDVARKVVEMQSEKLGSGERERERVYAIKFNAISGSKSEMLF